MTAKAEIETAGLTMVLFLQKYTFVLSKQIESVQNEMNESANKVVQALEELTLATEGERNKAEQVLESTYLSPDEKTKELVENIQQSADDIFEQATSEMNGSAKTNSTASLQSQANSDDIRRMGGLFSKHMESISTLDANLQDIVLSMVGAMSSSDVIKIRLDHLRQAIIALHTGLLNVMVDLESKLSPELIADFRARLLNFTFQSYTMEHEKETFRKVFKNFRPELTKTSSLPSPRKRAS